MRRMKDTKRVLCFIKSLSNSNCTQCQLPSTTFTMVASLLDNVEYDWQHILKATCLAGIATLLLIYQQTRHGFYTTRKAFIEYKCQCNRTLIESTEAAAKE